MFVVIFVNTVELIVNIKGNLTVFVFYLYLLLVPLQSNSNSLNCELIMIASIVEHWLLVNCALTYILQFSADSIHFSFMCFRTSFHLSGHPYTNRSHLLIFNRGFARSLVHSCYIFSIVSVQSNDSFHGVH